MTVEEIIKDMLSFESGEMSHDEMVEMFQDIADNGMIHELQGFYKRTAKNLIEVGMVTVPNKDIRQPSVAA